MELTWTSGPICLDEVVTVEAQYPTNCHWNGFLVPSLDPLACVTVLDALAEELTAWYADWGGQGHRPPTYEWVDGNLEVTDYDGDNPYVSVYHPDEDGLYGLGAYSWVWSEDR